MSEMVAVKDRRQMLQGHAAAKRLSGVSQRDFWEEDDELDNSLELGDLGGWFT
jgi:hypothetical protein